MRKIYFVHSVQIGRIEALNMGVRGRYIVPRDNICYDSHVQTSSLALCQNIPSSFSETGVLQIILMVTRLLDCFPISGHFKIVWISVAILMTSYFYTTVRSKKSTFLVGALSSYQLPRTFRWRHTASPPSGLFKVSHFQRLSFVGFYHLSTVH
jgi:hypothetical protein